MLKDSWMLHWRKWKDYFREDVHLFGLLFFVNFMMEMVELLKKQILMERTEMEHSQKGADSLFFNHQQEQLIVLLSILKTAAVLFSVVLFVHMLVFFISHSLKESIIQEEVIRFKILENVSPSRMMDELLLEKWSALPLLYLLSLLLSGILVSQISKNRLFTQSIPMNVLLFSSAFKVCISLVCIAPVLRHFVHKKITDMENRK